MNSNISVSIALVDCENLLESLSHFKSEVPSTCGFTVSLAVILEPSKEVLTDAILDYDILICNPATALPIVSEILHTSDTVKGKPLDELLVNVLASNEPLQYLQTIIKRVALLKDGFRDLAVYFKGDSMQIIPSFAALKLKNCFSDEDTSEHEASLEYTSTGKTIKVIFYKPLLTPREESESSEFTHWIHWLNAFESVSLSEEDSLFLLNAARSTRDTVLIYPE